MNTRDYIKARTDPLVNNFYQKLNHDYNIHNTEMIKYELNILCTDNLIDHRSEKD